MSATTTNAELQATFQEQGFAVARGLFNEEEAALLLEIATRQLERGAAADSRRDAGGMPTGLAIRNELGADIFSAVVRSERVVSTMEALLAGEAYHYHHKLMVKDAVNRGAWEWHQDYGYWYENGCLFPHMASCMLALSAATRANGCLEFLSGSHHMGRLDHSRRGDQAAADPERVLAASARLKSAPCELAPGDAVFFHCNTLHRSGPNTSGDPRWSLICCYNAASNDPYRDHHHPRYTPLERLPDAAVSEIGRAQLATLDP